MSPAERITSTRSTLAALPLLLCALLAGCGTDSFIPAGTVAGNWFVYNVAFTQGTTIIGIGSIGGPITQIGNTLSASFHIDAPCFGNGQTTIPLTGSINLQTDSFTLYSPSSNGGETVDLRGTFSSTRDTFSNGYLSVSGSCTGDLVSQTGDDKGAILNPRGTRVPSLSGSWAFLEAFLGPALSEQLTQSATADAQGRFALTGTASISGSPCFTTGILQPGSYISGIVGRQIILLNDGSTLSSPILFNPQSLPNKSSLELYPGTITGGNCNGPVDIYLQ